jgi:hypothetical protein
MKDDPETVEQAAGYDEPQRQGGQRRHHRVVDHEAAPAHRQIEPDREPVETARQHELDHDADSRHAPHADQKRDAKNAVFHLRDERRVGRRDQHIDCRMVEAPQHPFGARDRPQIIGCRQHQHGQQSHDVNRYDRNLEPVGIHGREHEQHGRRDQAAKHADSVHDAVGDQFGPIVIPANGAGRRMDGGRGQLLQSEDGHGGPGFTFESLKHT